MTLRPGTRLGPYEVVAPLGAGGMGEVYRARDTRLGREVAVKVLPASFTDNAERLQRFEQEARAAGALNHPNILAIHDVGKHDGGPYVVSELLEGETLREQLKNGELPVRKTLDYALQIASGLAAAHERGIVHRDLKPENLIITKDERVKILDFGLAKLRPKLVDTEAPTQRQLTDPRVVMGTVGYMSPEQVRGHEVDHRADIFSFGATLYEMLSSRRAFQRETMAETMTAILKEDPPELGEVNSKVSPALERIVRRCLEKKRERRFQSAHDLAFAIEALTTPSSSQASAVVLPDVPEAVGAPRRWLSPERLIWLAATVLLALTTVGVAWMYFTRLPAAYTRVVKSSILPPENTSFEHLAVSPDGRWLAFTAATGGKLQLWLRAFARAEAQAISGTEGATLPFWSPDSRFIAFFAAGKLKKIEVSGGIPTTLCDVGVATGGTWSREGVILFSALGGAGLSRVSATGGEVISVMRPDPKSQETEYFQPYFLPDGQHFLYSVQSGQKEVRGVYLGGLNGGASKHLMPDFSNAMYAVSETGEGYLLFGRDDALMAQRFDATQLQLTGEPVLVAEQVGKLLGSAIITHRRNFSVSDEGLLVLDPFPNRLRTHLLWVDRQGRKTIVLDEVDNATLLRLSPDGKRVVVARYDPQIGGSDLWLSDETGSSFTRFTFDPGIDHYPIWSPGGDRIVWSSSREGTFDLYQKAASGSGQDALLFKSDYYKFSTDWSRDGRFIIYRQMDPKTKHDVWVLPVGPQAGEQNPFPFLQTEANESGAVLSPDGQSIAYSSDESGRYEIYVQSFPGGGGKRQISNAGGLGPHWRDDGRELYYHAPDGKLMAVAVKGGLDFEAGSGVALFEFRAAGTAIAPFYSVSKDGQRFLLSTIVENVTGAPLTVVVNWTADLKR